MAKPVNTKYFLHKFLSTNLKIFAIINLGLGFVANVFRPTNFMTGAVPDHIVHAQQIINLIC